MPNSGQQQRDKPDAATTDTAKAAAPPSTKPVFETDDMETKNIKREGEPLGANFA